MPDLSVPLQRWSYKQHLKKITIFHLVQLFANENILLILTNYSVLTQKNENDYHHKYKQTL